MLIFGGRTVAILRNKIFRKDAQRLIILADVLSILNVIWCIIQFKQFDKENPEEIRYIEEGLISYIDEEYYSLLFYLGMFILFISAVILIALYKSLYAGAARIWVNILEWVFIFGTVILCIPQRWITKCLFFGLMLIGLKLLFICLYPIAIICLLCRLLVHDNYRSSLFFLLFSLILQVGGVHVLKFAFYVGIFALIIIIFIFILNKTSTGSYTSEQYRKDAED